MVRQVERVFSVSVPQIVGVNQWARLFVGSGRKLVRINIVRASNINIDSDTNNDNNNSSNNDNK